MNKNDLIQKLADHTGIDKNTSAKAVDGVFDLIASTLKSGEEVRLTGFGVFVVATRAGGIPGDRAIDKSQRGAEVVNATAVDGRGVADHGADAEKHRSKVANASAASREVAGNSAGVQRERAAAIGTDVVSAPGNGVGDGD